MCWAGLFLVGWICKPSVAVLYLSCSLEPGIGRSSEGYILCLLARSSFASLERAIASSIDLRAVFIRSSERGVSFRVPCSSEHSVARACSRVSDLKHCILGSSEILFARAS